VTTQEQPRNNPEKGNSLFKKIPTNKEFQEMNFRKGRLRKGKLKKVKERKESFRKAA